eukprot:scaffold1638_cov258-Pinguiococcus_pyrenoidosus.AAC.21
MCARTHTFPLSLFSFFSLCAISALGRHGIASEGTSHTWVGPPRGDPVLCAAPSTAASRPAGAAASHPRPQADSQGDPPLRRPTNTCAGALPARAPAAPRSSRCPPRYTSAGTP